jgi:hypothetical protein
MNLALSRYVLVLTASTGCVGAYAELAVTKLSSTTLSPTGGGATTDGGGASQVGFNVGVEFGSYKQRFAMGYAAEALSSDPGDSKFTGAAFRYDRQVYAPIERLGLRLGGGILSGQSTFTMNNMKNEDNAYGVFGGVGATFFATWRTPVHAFFGYEAASANTPGGSLTGTGFTFRAGVSLMAKDVRGSVEFVVPLDSARDLTGVIKDGADALGCVTVDQMRTDTIAKLEVVCPGKRHIEYFQIAEGMLVTCEKEVSKKRCEKLSSSIVDAALGKKPERTSTPTPTPAAAPTPPAAPTPDPAPTTPVEPVAPAAPADPAAPAAPAPAAPAAPATAPATP